MTVQSLADLALLISREREALLARWRSEVKRLPSARELDVPSLNDHIPGLLDELVLALQSVSERTIVDALLEGSPPAHGIQRSQEGFDIVEVVAEYNILRACIDDLADGAGLVLHGKAFRILNRVLDESIGLAVQTFATQKALEVQRRRDEYLAFVAHDLRTPLNAISLAAKVIGTLHPELGADASTAKLLKALQRNVQTLEALVEQVLKESEHVHADGGVKLRRRHLDLWPLVEALVYDIHPVAATAGAELINSVPLELTVCADAALLRRVFQNLIANALRYAPRGKVTIEARQSTDGSVECLVVDNGAGIPREQLEVIFEPMETDPDNDGGTGLGLAIVKTFVEAHGGVVEVESREGIGTTFRFTIPSA